MGKFYSFQLMGITFIFYQEPVLGFMNNLINYCELDIIGNKLCELD